MMNSLRLQKNKKVEDNIYLKAIKDIRNLLRQKREMKMKEIDYTAIKEIRNLFRPNREKKAIEDRVIRYIRNLFEHEEDYYKPVRVGIFQNDNYVEYESNSDRNKTLSVEEYLKKLNHAYHFIYIINDLKECDTGKVQLTVAVNLMSSKDNDKERIMHSKSDNIEIMINDKVDEITE